MSDADVFQALSDAASQDAAAEQAAVEAPPAPVEAPAPVEGAPVNETPPVEGQAPEAPQADEPYSFDPNSLPEELIPVYRQMQASFTPRLQEAAEVRQQLEALGGVDAVQQAVELAQWIQNPQNWPDVYETMYQMMEESGFEFEEPGAPAGPSPIPNFDPSDDPDLAPIVQSLQTLEQRTAQQQALIEQFEAQQRAQQEYAALEFQQMQHMAELQRQMGAIRQSNPSYTDDDLRAVVELASFYNDDLLAAQQRYESIVADRLNRYIESKRAAGTAPSIQPPAGVGVTSHEEVAHETIRDAEEEVVELMRRLQAAGDLDL